MFFNGNNEDRNLEIEFLRICKNQDDWGWRPPSFQEFDFKSVFVSKMINSGGLQLADLMARPLALKHLKPQQRNRVLEVITPKLKGFKVFLEKNRMSL